MFYAFNCKTLKKVLKFIVLVCIWAFVLYTAVCVIFPFEHIATIEKYAEKYNLDTALVCAVINVESHFDEEAVSNKGASGLMQIMEKTADWAAQMMPLEGYSYDNIYDVDMNIDIGCWYLNRLMEQYDGDMTLVMAAYNAGSGNVNNWLYDDKYSSDGKTLIKIPYEETKKYVVKIKINKFVYDKLLRVKIYEK